MFVIRNMEFLQITVKGTSPAAIGVGMYVLIVEKWVTLLMYAKKSMDSHHVTSFQIQGAVLTAWWQEMMQSPMIKHSF